MKMLLAVGGLGFVIAIAITLLVVRAVRRARPVVGQTFKIMGFKFVVNPLLEFLRIGFGAAWTLTSIARPVAQVVGQVAGSNDQDFFLE